MRSIGANFQNIVWLLAPTRLLNRGHPLCFRTFFLSSLTKDKEPTEKAELPPFRTWARRSGPLWLMSIFCRLHCPWTMSKLTGEKAHNVAAQPPNTMGMLISPKKKERSKWNNSPPHITCSYVHPFVWAPKPSAGGALLTLLQYTESAKGRLCFFFLLWRNRVSRLPLSQCLWCYTDAGQAATSIP